MTIDERLEVLSDKLFPFDDGDVMAEIRLALLDVARAQRHADAEVLMGCRKTVIGSKPRTFIELDEAHQAVMNAKIE